MEQSIAPFLPTNSMRNTEKKQPKVIPSFNKDTAQDASFMVMFADESSSSSFGIMGDVHPRNMPTLSWARLTVFEQHSVNVVNPRIRWIVISFFFLLTHKGERVKPNTVHGHNCHVMSFPRGSRGNEALRFTANIITSIRALSGDCLYWPPAKVNDVRV